MVTSNWLTITVVTVAGADGGTEDTAEIQWKRQQQRLEYVTRTRRNEVDEGLIVECGHVGRTSLRSLARVTAAARYSLLQCLGWKRSSRGLLGEDETSSATTVAM